MKHNSNAVCEIVEQDHNRPEGHPTENRGSVEQNIRFIFYFTRRSKFKQPTVAKILAQTNTILLTD